MLKVTHNCGFFSCCSVKLGSIIHYFNTNKELPLIVDSSEQFWLYKKNKNEDITNHFFDIQNCSGIEFKNDIYFSIDYHNGNYKNINNLSELLPFVEKYFSPSLEIIEIEQKLIKKYNIEPEKYCSLYYRGTDKRVETILGSYEIFLDKMEEIKLIDNEIKFIIQSDDKFFIDFIKEKRSNIIIFEENIPSIKSVGKHFENTHEQNYNEMKNFFSILLIMSKCKYVICSTSNCSLWIAFYRKNMDNFYQFLNNNWY